MTIQPRMIILPRAKVEDLTSALEDLRNIGQERLHQEAMLAINWPDTVYCDDVLRDSLSLFFASAKRAGDRKGHFVRRSNDIKCYDVSKAVDTVVKEKTKLQIMVD